MGFRAAERCRLSGRQRLYEAYPVVELGQIGAGQSQIPRTAVSRAQPQHHAVRGKQLQRRDGGGRNRRMARRQVGDAERYPRLPHVAGDDRGGDPRVHRVARRIGDADRVIAPTVGGCRHPPGQLGRVGPEEETDLHLRGPRSVEGPEGPPGPKLVVAPRFARVLDPSYHFTGSGRASHPNCPWLLTPKTARSKSK